MERRNFLKSASVVGLTGALVSACDPTLSSKNQGGNMTVLQPGGTIVHSVYFWLKEGLSQEEEDDFLGFFDALKKIPEVRTLQYGKPAATNPRPVVDNSFSYNLIVTFDTMDNINIYETHPDHLSAVERYGKYWTKVLVMDTVVVS